ncbi:MAG: rhomboid family intramembrane serine protease [Kiritimatiellia bacterium]|nr:rhomboid family intramembrane serine protease [Kiritimatiellia bacterium]MDD4173504.1 rhomboid family intramembrane serine protease [Kiritimatiellia bacterium]MDD4441133.1 rhomboid family intramembrane serine protease [Kiritimatiellia bacterium]MDX9792508.1 rhomboid family intramembrane serine protease [Kiritimatiellia bacterium]NLC82593.1 rhomboid family intramembrane serine protease [Lentisphaerota bacterium]
MTWPAGWAPSFRWSPTTRRWWRLLTASFVHVSAYHLALDAGAFLLLYHTLHEPSRPGRLLAVAACAAGSLAASLLTLAPDGSLCGLSGVGHGLLAVSALSAGWPLWGCGDWQPTHEPVIGWRSGP